MRAGDDGETGLPGRLLREMVSALPEDGRPEAVRRLLAEVERIHHEQGVTPPGWVRRLREETGG